MATKVITLFAAFFASQVTGQVYLTPGLYDPLDPLGLSRPAVEGAYLSSAIDPLGASRPGGLPYELDPLGLTRNPLLRPYDNYATYVTPGANPVQPGLIQPSLPASYGTVPVAGAARPGTAALVQHSNGVVYGTRPANALPAILDPTGATLNRPGVGSTISYPGTAGVVQQSAATQQQISAAQQAAAAAQHAAAAQQAAAQAAAQQAAAQAAAQQAAAAQQQAAAAQQQAAAQQAAAQQAAAAGQQAAAQQLAGATASIPSLG